MNKRQEESAIVTLVCFIGMVVIMVWAAVKGAGHG
jgi:hypothetical protein